MSKLDLSVTKHNSRIAVPSGITAQLLLVKGNYNLKYMQPMRMFNVVIDAVCLYILNEFSRSPFFNNFL